MNENPIIVALDVPTIDEAARLADAVGDAAGAFKVGLQLFSAEGPAAVRALGDREFPAFVAKAFAIERMQMNGDVVHVHADVLRTHGAEDLLTADGEGREIKSDHVEVPGCFPIRKGWEQLNLRQVAKRRVVGCNDFLAAP